LANTRVCSNTSGWHSKNIWGTFEDLDGMNCIAVDCATTSECDTDANVWNVPADFPTIQEAINAAGPDDTIEVAPGTYPEFLDMEGKRISLIARNPAPGLTIIQAPAIGSPGGGGPDGDGATPCIKFTSGETTRLDDDEMPIPNVRGFTLQGGTGTPMFADALFPSGLPGGFTVGGGILCYRSMPTIDSCIIRENLAFDGGGVYSGGQSAPILTGPTYLCDNLLNNLSGYVDVVDACMSPTCNDTNPADGIPDSCQGGGVNHPLDTASGPNAIADTIALADSGDTISLAAGTYLETINPMGKAIQFVGAGPGLTILDGGGVNRLIVCVAGETDGTIFSNLTVTGGYAGGGIPYGGGALLSSSSPVFTNVEFTDNRSTDSGGGIFMSNGASPEFTNCTFDGNIADWMGGAIHALVGCQPVFTDTTFSNNQAGLTGGAVCLITAPSGTPPSYPNPYPHGLIGNQPDFFNCTFTYNRAYRYGGGVYAGFASPALFDDCTFDNNAGEWGGGGIYVQSVYDYADLNDGEPSEAVLAAYYPTLANGTLFRCNEPQAISGDAQAWYDPWSGSLNVSANCLTCAPDVNKDLYVDSFDLFRVIDAWGDCDGNNDDPPAPVLCDEDIDGDYVVDIKDLIAVLQNWRRTCPIE
jgi:predicted outer membrane repeat protein